MILKELGKFYRIQSLTRQQWRETSTKQCVFLLSTLFLVFLALFFDISRMGGAIYETAGRPTGYIKGPCISYDSETQKLFTTPHNPGCANYADWFMILSASGIIISILLSLIAAVFVKFEIRKKFQNTAIGMYQQVSTRNS